MAFVQVAGHSPVAQLVERLTVNQEVAGSRPARGANLSADTPNMSFINLTVAHGLTLDEARHRLERAVHEVSSRFGGVRRVEWAADRNRVKLEGTGVRVEMWVDAENVHATGDIPILGELLGGPVASGLKQIVQGVFQKKLP